MFAGVRKIVDVALEVNKRRGSQQIKFIDVGGGYFFFFIDSLTRRLPVNFDSEEDSTENAPSVQEYVRLLKAKCPELFSGAYTVYTEFGRRYNAKPGNFQISRNS